jgi:hypothetical protein
MLKSIISMQIHSMSAGKRQDLNFMQNGLSWPPLAPIVGGVLGLGLVRWGIVGLEEAWERLIRPKESRAIPTEDYTAS